MNLIGLLLFVIVVLGYFLQLRHLGISAYLGWITSIWIMILTMYVFAMLG